MLKENEAEKRFNAEARQSMMMFNFETMSYYQLRDLLKKVSNELMTNRGWTITDIDEMMDL